MSESLSFVLAKDVNFSDAQLYGKIGDLVVHTPPTKLVVYRNGEIMKAFELSKVSIQGLVNVKALIADESKVVAAVEKTVTEVETEVKKVATEVIDEVKDLIEPKAEAAPEAPAPAPVAEAPEAPAPEGEAAPAGDATEETEDIPESEETPEQVATAAVTGVKPKRVKKAPATK